MHGADLAALALRLGVFALVVGALYGAERRWPLRPAAPGRGARWRDNFLLVACGVVLMRLLPVLSAVGAAFVAQRHAFGLMHVAGLRLGIALPLALVLLDGALYFQHRLMHSVGPLWRLHRVHHSDRDLDFTTALRFHPLEILFSSAYKAACASLLGAPPAAVLLFEILLNGSAMFNHANLGLAPRLERALRRVLVTPAMHWTHHSIVPRESRRNFGFCLSGWDRLFGTYQQAPARGYAGLELGIEGLDDPAPGLLDLLTQPARDLPAPADGSYLRGDTRGGFSA